MIQKASTILLVFLCLFQHPVFAQSQKINGVVTEQETGKPLPGVSILLKDGGLLGVSDASGRFTVDVLGPSAVLVFKYVGYVDYETTVGERKILQVKLLSDSKSLDEVVVIG